ncbi:MAG: hypothetical protein HY327_06145 [Chloroflexi bacterium]|nr:hypothetical protein [Chloroflexota bacterium]
MFNFFQSLFQLGNIILSSAIIIVAFSLWLYLLAYNFRHPVARAFSALLAFLTIVYIGDVFLQRAGGTNPDVIVWLKFKWIGLAFIPAAYLHFSDAVLRATYLFRQRRRIAVMLSYLIGGVFLLLVAFSDLVVRDGIFFREVAQFSAGPLFWLFALFFVTLTGWGFYNLRLARQRCLTQTTRRRMRYLQAAFLAPALGVFPFLIIASFPQGFSVFVLLLIAFVGKIGIAGMIIMMAYTVAYQGALSPDRIIKHNLIHYLLRGPLVAVAVVGLMFSVPTVQEWLGLTRETLLFAMVIAAIVALELLVNRFKPWIDRLIFWNDRRELERFQEIDERLLTTSDLRQLLENILAATCDLLRVPGGFVAAAQADDWQILAIAGTRASARRWAEAADWNRLSEKNGNGVIAQDGYWLWRLRTKSRDQVIGWMGVPARAPELDLSAREHELIDALAAQAALALEDRQLQLSVFAALEQLSSEIELIQQARSRPRYAGELAIEQVEAELIASPDFHQAVKDALEHFWGGPKLTANPLLQLSIVQDALDDHAGNPVRALRALILRAVESLKPDGARSLTAPEWVLYNILELKLVQGKKIRDIAYQLAVSESDLYRKQRVAIEQVSQTLAAMEQGARKT